MKIAFKEAIRIENLKAKVALKARVALKPSLTKNYCLTAYFQSFSDRFNDILGQVVVPNSPFLALYVRCSPFCCEWLTLNCVFPLKLVFFPSYGFIFTSTHLAKVGGRKGIMGFDCWFNGTHLTRKFQSHSNISTASLCFSLP